MIRLSAPALVLGVFALLACSKEPPPSTATSATNAHAPAPGTESKPQGGAVALVDPSAKAEVGRPAPDFALKDLDGNEVKLASFKGKTVVLEWFNPGCPFVKNSHTKGSLVDTAKRRTRDGTVWLAINSGAAGKQGAGAEANREGAKKFSMTHPILLDEAGAVGKAYGATNTPHMYVIDKQGMLVYKGAIDNSPDGEGKSPTDGKLVNYVDIALDAIAAGKPVEKAETKAYGCSVKYGH